MRGSTGGKLAGRASAAAEDRLGAGGARRTRDGGRGPRVRRGVRSRVPSEGDQAQPRACERRECLRVGNGLEAPRGLHCFAEQLSHADRPAPATQADSGPQQEVERERVGCAGREEEARVEPALPRRPQRAESRARLDPVVGDRQRGGDDRQHDEARKAAAARARALPQRRRKDDARQETDRGADVQDVLHERHGEADAERSAEGSPGESAHEQPQPGQPPASEEGKAVALGWLRLAVALAAPGPRRSAHEQHVAQALAEPEQLVQGQAVAEAERNPI